MMTIDPIYEHSGAIFNLQRELNRLDGVYTEIRYFMGAGIRMMVRTYRSEKAALDIIKQFCSREKKLNIHGEKIVEKLEYKEIKPVIQTISNSKDFNIIVQSNVK